MFIGMSPGMRTTVCRLLYTVFAFCCATGGLNAYGQTSSDSSSLSVSGYVDTYYAFDFSKPPTKNRSFTTMPFRHNEFNVNLALVDFQYAGQAVHARMALQTGTYAQANYALEDAPLQNLHEAYAGFRLGKSNWWVDMGVFGSHIGMEGAITMQYWNYSRSLMADYSPYYLAGVKLSGPLSAKTTFTFLVTNGWQNIKETNNDKAFGTQLQLRPNDRVLLNWSTFVGNEAPETAPSQIRIFNDWYASVQVSEKVKAALAFDLGFQKRAVASGYDTWHTAGLLTQFRVAPTVAVGARAEYYLDKRQVIVATGTPDGFQTVSASVNLDYAPLDNVLWRVEGRVYRSKNAVFPTASGSDRSSGFIVTSIAVSIK